MSVEHTFDVSSKPAGMSQIICNTRTIQPEQVSGGRCINLPSERKESEVIHVEILIFFFFLTRLVKINFF